MRIVEFNRLVSKKEGKLHRELTDVQKTIEATLGDLDINPVITIDEVCEKLTELCQKYNGIIYAEAAELFDSIFNVLENGVEGVEDVRLDIYGILLEVFFKIEDIKVATSAPEVKLTKDALENVKHLMTHPEAKKLNITVFR
ncbi:MAG: hypothetical protein IKA62_05460 [Clostridia bacterium]|nr:hypothetical protein [Clostridia bacterium]